VIAPTPASSAPTPKPVIAPQRGGAYVLSSKMVTTIACPDACTGAVKLTIGKLDVGAAAFSLPPHKLVAVPIAVTPLLDKLLSARPSHTLLVTETVATSDGTDLARTILVHEAPVISEPKLATSSPARATVPLLCTLRCAGEVVFALGNKTVGLRRFLLAPHRKITLAVRYTHAVTVALQHAKYHRIVLVEIVRVAGGSSLRRRLVLRLPVLG
jgi:hypothetical protein